MIQNLRVARVVRVQARFSVKQWELYEQHTQIAVTPDKVAGVLNMHLERFVNDDKLDKNATRECMLEVMRRHERWGANDSEPIKFLDSVLDEIFGE